MRACERAVHLGERKLVTRNHRRDMTPPAHTATRRSPLRRALPWMLLAVALAGTAYLLMRTVWLQGTYIGTVRDMYFGCMQASDNAYVYRMAAGPCTLKNREYDVVMTHDDDGFRITAAPASSISPPRGGTPRVAVIGDSHAYGHGVNDDQTFAALLAARLAEPVRNLALPATATQRELDALHAHARDAQIVVLQYCDNDFGENRASLEMGLPLFRKTLRERMAEVIKNYEYTKQQSPVQQAFMTVSYALAQLVQSRVWRLPSVHGDETTLAQEADAFARVLEGHASMLQGKTVVVLESSGWGRNRKHFQSVFAQRLSAIPQVNWVVLDSATLLDRDDYFRLDDHVNASGHRKLAVALDGVIRARPASPPTLR